MQVGVFGATGQVGSVMLALLQERRFPATSVRLFGTQRSAGRLMRWADRDVVVESAADADFSGIDIALCSMGATASRSLAPAIAAAGAVVIDNSSAWRMDPEVPLVVPEVNRKDASHRPKGIIANPNCTTMIAMPSLAALRDAVGLEAVLATTFQAVSGAGRAGVAELANQVASAGDATPLAFDGSAVGVGPVDKFPAPIAYNVVPMAGALVDDETEEEHKFRNESRKILGLDSLAVHCTCVRVPVYTGHSVSVTVKLSSAMSTPEASKALASAPGNEFSDLPTPLLAAGRDPCFVGRVRTDEASRLASFFVSGDNLRKGAALNAIQIAEALV